jgi:hypothetical protein
MLLHCSAKRSAFSMRSEAWKRSYVFDVDLSTRSVRLVTDGATVATLSLGAEALERVAVRYNAEARAWQWLIAHRGEERVRVLPHDDDLSGHAQFAAALSALDGFDHRAYALALTTPQPPPDALHMLWRPR